MQLKAKEAALTDAMMICDRCSCDIAPVKTIRYVNDDLHFLTCPYLNCNRVELVEAQSSAYDHDREFINLYLEDYENLKASIKKTERQSSSTSTYVQPRDFAYARCQKNHIIGVIVD